VLVEFFLRGVLLGDEKLHLIQCSHLILFLFNLPIILSFFFEAVPSQQVFNASLQLVRGIVDLRRKSKLLGLSLIHLHSNFGSILLLFCQEG